MGWVVARITLALVIAGVLGYRWHDAKLSWPLILMAAFICGLLVLEMFTAHRKTSHQDVDADGEPTPQHRATDIEPAAGDMTDGV